MGVRAELLRDSTDLLVFGDLIGSCNRLLLAEEFDASFWKGSLRAQRLKNFNLA